MLLIIVNKKEINSVNLPSYVCFKQFERFFSFYLSISSISNFRRVKIQFKKNSLVHDRWNFFYIAHHFYKLFVLTQKKSLKFN